MRRTHRSAVDQAGTRQVGIDIFQRKAQREILAQLPPVGQAAHKLARGESTRQLTLRISEFQQTQVEIIDLQRYHLPFGHFLVSRKVGKIHVIGQIAQPGRVRKRNAVVVFQVREFSGIPVSGVGIGAESNTRVAEGRRTGIGSKI